MTSPKILSLTTIPALLTKISTPPRFRRTHSKDSLISFSSLRSHLIGWKFLQTFCNSSILWYLLAKPTTLTPFSTRAFAIAAPIPELAPVTTATLFNHRSIFASKTSLCNCSQTTRFVSRSPFYLT